MSDIEFYVAMFVSMCLCVPLLLMDDKWLERHVPEKMVWPIQVTGIVLGSIIVLVLIHWLDLPARMGPGWEL